MTQWQLLCSTTPKRALIQRHFKVLTMNNSQRTQSTNGTEITKNDKSQQKQQRFLRRVITGALVAQAALIGVEGNLDVLSGQPVLDIIPGMITQGVELILKTQGVQKRLKTRDRNCNSCSD